MSKSERAVPYRPTYLISREKLLESLEQIRASLCCYVNSESFCDCKYGPDFSRHSSENRGCPEVRMAIRILKLIPERQFAELLEKADSYAAQ